MQNETKTPQQSAPRTLRKPARERREMSREELVVYTDEGGGDATSGGNDGKSDNGKWNNGKGNL